MNERFPIKKEKNPAHSQPQEDAPMSWKQPTEEDFARVSKIAEKAHPVTHIMRNRLRTMFAYTARNLTTAGITQETLTKNVLAKAISAALDSHSGSIMRDRRKLYRRAAEELFRKFAVETERNDKKVPFAQREDLYRDTINTMLGRGDNPEEEED